MYSVRISSLLAVLVTLQTGLGSILELPWLQPRASGSVDSFITTERPIALQGILNNLGPDGSKAAGAHAGILIASPFKFNPNYYYTWTRDSALTFKLLVDSFVDGESSLQSHIEDYIVAQTKVQTIVSPSGQLTNGSGLGEPKYYVNETAFDDPWGRPQRDGPALRATAMIAYTNWLLGINDHATVSNVLWPIIHNDLAYVAQYWNQTGFDLWEEVEGSSFFTIAAQHRALVEGGILATKIKQKCDGCSSQAPQVLCFLQSFWNGTNIISNINDDSGRSGKDVNSILSSIQTFDPLGGCDDSTFQPCSSRALANHKVVTDSFRDIYSINSGIAQGKAVAVGRYPEDVYYGGNPWYLNTLAAAEQLYDALYQWKKVGSITVDLTNLAFFKDLSSTTKTGTYKSSSSTYTELTAAVKAYADGYVAMVEKHTPSNGALAEQYSRENGTAVSAGDLTWSYAAFLSCAARRNGTMPASWGESNARIVPAVCSSTSAVGAYATPTNTQFPSKSTSTATTTAGFPCPTSSTVKLTFDMLVSTSWGEDVFVVGSVDQLGSWVPNEGIPLSASKYSSVLPLWFGTVNLAAGTAFEYKLVRLEEDGSVIWQVGDNRGESRIGPSRVLLSGDKYTRFLPAALQQYKVVGHEKAIEKWYRAGR